MENNFRSASKYCMPRECSCEHTRASITEKFSSWNFIFCIQICPNKSLLYVQGVKITLISYVFPHTQSKQTSCTLHVFSCVVGDRGREPGKIRAGSGQETVSGNGIDMPGGLYCR